MTRASPFTERMEDVERIVEVGQICGATTCTLEFHPFTQARAVVADHRFERRKSGEFLGPCDAVARLDHPTRHPAEALGLDDHQDRFLAKKISSAVPCFTAGRAASSSTFEQGTGTLTGHQGRPPQGGHARSGFRPLHEPEQPPGHAQADSLGLGDGGELVRFVGGDLDGVLEPLLEGLDVSMQLGELSLKLVDPGLGRGAVHGVGDLLGLAVKRLPRWLPVLGHLGDVAGSSAEDGENAPAMRCGIVGMSTHSVEAGWGNPPTIAHVPEGIVHGLPRRRPFLRKSRLPL